ncbi:4'-phosphopantetheinyl transferase superfamily protein [Thalassococcus sp. S3]|uniref:4'-phosphopantetheinyl transferase family protein n=1 Tax=Thalassococcus sp. S3 TaxID=2017482 RepID=UPI001024199A|nr:4'-phosphopantetheinyl transferase superfamily protein [Thalassococcus sp. S3]QBF29679.1 4-phosphopantetheinyl transferase [Thalassococcus sp. S3]
MTAVDVLHVVACADQPDLARTCLSATERAHAKRIANTAARALYISAHETLRRALAERLDIAPRRVPIVAGWNGRPELAEGARPSFNLSHSGGRAIIAICDEGDVGVDIERQRPRRSASRLAERLFAEEERTALAALEPACFSLAFTELWTLKEAFIKATGEGLARPLNSFAIDWTVPRLVRGQGDADWVLDTLPVGPGYRAALAIRGASSCSVTHKIAKPLQS